MCIFAIVALVGKNKTIVQYHTLLLILGLTLALGRFTSIHFLLYKYFPFFGYIRYPVRFFFLFNFAAACLAGFGIDKILASRSAIVAATQKGYITRLAFLILISVAALLLGIVYLDRSQNHIYTVVKSSFEKWTQAYCAMDSVVDMTKPVLENLKRSFILGLLTCAGIFCAYHLKVRRSIIAIFFGLLIFSDLVDVNIIEMRIEKEYMTKPGFNVEKILEDKDLFRVMASPRTAKMQLLSRVEDTLGKTQQVLMEALTPNFLLHYRIFDTVGYDSIHLKGPIGINSVRDKAFSHHFFDILNVKYLASPMESLGDSFELTNKTAYVNIFRNKTVLPRAFLVKKAEVIKDTEKILINISEKPFDPEELLYLEEDADFSESNLQQTSSTLSNRTEIVEYKPEHVRMRVESRDKPWLFFSEAYFPGWKALVDGQETKIYKANFAFRAIHLEPGEHDVEWVYEPTSLRLGLLISLLSLLAVLSYLIWYRFGQKAMSIG